MTLFSFQIRICAFVAFLTTTSFAQPVESEATRVVRQWAEAGVAYSDFGNEIAKAKEAFLCRYPSKAGFSDARERYLILLRQRDYLYMQTLVYGDVTDNRETRAFLSNGFGPLLGRGDPNAALPDKEIGLFLQWIGAIRNAGHAPAKTWAPTSEEFTKALVASQPTYIKYSQRREEIEHSEWLEAHSTIKTTPPANSPEEAADIYIDNIVAPAFVKAFSGQSEKLSETELWSSSLRSAIVAFESVKPDLSKSVEALKQAKLPTALIQKFTEETAQTMVSGVPDERGMARAYAFAVFEYDKARGVPGQRVPDAQAIEGTRMFLKNVASPLSGRHVDEIFSQVPFRFDVIRYWYARDVILRRGLSIRVPPSTNADLCPK